MEELPRLRLRRRKYRRPFYEVICKCDAYRYPHRFGGGGCNGLSLAEYFWANGSCGNCRFRSFDDWNGSPVCQAINGQEELAECEQLQEFLRVNEAYSKRLPKK